MVPLAQPSQLWDYQHKQSLPAFYVDAAAEAQSLCLFSRRFCHLIQPPALRLSPNSYCHPSVQFSAHQTTGAHQKMCASEGHALLPSPYNFGRKNRETHFGEEETEVYGSESQVQIQRTKY